MFLPEAPSTAWAPGPPREASLEGNRYLLNYLVTLEDRRPPWGEIDPTFQQYPES